MRISQDAVNLIVAEEVSSKAYYEKHYRGFEWPGGASGPTVGIGYDCAYCTRAEIAKDWAGLISESAIATLQTAAGRKGNEGRAFVAANGRSVTIPWDAAIGEFRDRELPKWQKRLDKAVPNTDMLSPDSYGALLSIAYNRGVGVFLNAGDRYREGRVIRFLMENKQFDKIPAQIRSMKRLWNNGLVARREREAKLFERGLAISAGKPATPIPTRQETVVKTATQAGAVTGVGAGGSAVAIAPSAHAWWVAPVAIILSVTIVVCVTLYAMRFRRVPRAD